MTDARRARWIAFDAHFLDGTLGVALMDRFGPAGAIVFIAFLCACKKSHIQGQITYGSDAEALSIMGLSGIELVDPKGEHFDLQDVWRLLAAHKQINRSTRTGRLHTVRSSNWTKWQRGYQQQKDAERKAKSRAGNTADETADDPQTDNGQHTADTRTETDSDIETDKSSSFSGNTSARANGSTTDDDFWALVAQRRLAAQRAAGQTITDERRWVTTTARNARTELADRARELEAEFVLDRGQLADALNGNTNVLRSAQRRDP